MSHHERKQLTDADKAVLGEKAWPLYRLLMIGALVGLIVAVLAVALPITRGGWDRFGFAYLIAYAFALSIALGCQFFVIITTIFRAGWCVAFRRVPETVAASMPTMAVLSVPLLVFALAGNGSLWPWTHDGIHAYGRAMIAHSPVAPSTAQPRGEADLLHDDEDPGDHGGDHADDDDHAAAGQPGIFLTAAGEDRVHPAADGDPLDHPADYAGSDPGGAETHGGGHDLGHGEGHHQWTHTGDTWTAHDHAVPYYTARKGSWFTGPFWVLRWLLYVAVWSLIGLFYWKKSLAQDADADVQHTHRREWWAPLSVIAFAVTVTLASFDLILSLDPAWYSTMYGVYFFAGAFTCGICVTILVLNFGQKAGYFPAITTDHFHDLGKLLFAFVFFWGYVAFSQFMLIWYASFPETTYFWEIMGITSVSGDSLEAGAPTFGGPWTVVAWTLLFAHLLLPFAILLSKHMKRNRTVLVTMACWMLVLCYVDIYWFVMPRLSSPDLFFGLPEIGTLVFCVGVLLAEALRRAKDHSLTAHNDPRMHESIGLDTSSWAPIHE